MVETDVPGYFLDLAQKRAAAYYQNNFKIWFDASVISLLVLGAPDLYEYGLQGAMGVMTRTHGSC